MKEIAMPQLIPPLSDLEVRNAVEDCKRNFSTSRTLPEFPDRGHWQIRECDIHGGSKLLFARNSVSGDIGFFVRHRGIHLTDSLHAGRQFLLKKFVGPGTSISRLPHEVFWHLHSRYGLMASESQQTADGFKFWGYQIDHAFRHNRQVILVDTNDRTERVYTDMFDFEVEQSTIWGTSKWFQRKIVVIK